MRCLKRRVVSITRLLSGLHKGFLKNETENHIFTVLTCRLIFPLRRNICTSNAPSNIQQSQKHPNCVTMLIRFTSTHHCIHEKLTKSPGTGGRQEFECTRLDDQLMTHGDNVTFVARLSRRLRDGELRGKVYKLEPNATEVSAFFLLLHGYNGYGISPNYPAQACIVTN